MTPQASELVERLRGAVATKLAAWPEKLARLEALWSDQKFREAYLFIHDESVAVVGETMQKLDEEFFWEFIN